VDDSRAAVHGLRGREHLIGDRRGEDLAGTRGIEHARADETAVHRLVPGSAARDDRDLARGGVLADDDLVREVDADEVRMRRGEAGEGLADDVGRIVDELLS